jgi:hypothetical protein
MMDELGFGPFSRIESISARDKPKIIFQRHKFIKKCFPILRLPNLETQNQDVIRRHT